MKKMLTVGFIFPVLCAVASAASNHTPGLDKGAGYIEVDGGKLSIADIEAKKPALFFQARNNYYEAQRKAVEEFINDYLIEQQAAKEKVTPAELLQRHVNGTIAKDPAEEALHVYYEGLDVKESYDAVRDKIVDAIRERRIARAKAAYVQSLRSQAGVSLWLAPPRAAVSLNGAPVRGLADAPVMMVEYADYECPYCQTIQPVLDRLMAEYKGKLAIAYKDTPLPMHTNAQKAAEAAHCAGSQGKYWEYHDQIFRTKEYTVDKLKLHARGLQMDGEAFDKCLDSGQQADVVKAQLAEAQAFGVPGTPAFFINGRFLNPNGNVTYEALRQIIDEELRASPAQAKKSVGTE